ncbi:MAG: DUF1905 domain-containing protein [Microbacteriaceae bacterium]
MQLTFDSSVFEWRGPAPFYFAAVPDEESLAIREISSLVSYGWGVIPCSVTIGKTSITTSLFPKQGGYLVPLKDSLRKPERLNIGDHIKITLDIAV